MCVLVVAIVVLNGKDKGLAVQMTARALKYLAGAEDGDVSLYETLEASLFGAMFKIRMQAWD